ncbi:MAG: glucose-1-phosphate cytidylyltransferase [Acidobacteria bacterium]|nr:glucose-1-phosphate cytidylyltransferase [Acidobacteriota bacterium]
MKVVLFCGGLGMRMRDHSEILPKPMIHIGYRPILWHVMKYYAHFGYRDFVLCLGYKADVIKKYFLQYDECITNDFVLSHGGKTLKLLNRDIEDWNITFVDTGLLSNVGQRLMAVKEHVQDDAMFLANYTDGLTDLPIHLIIERFARSGKVACFASVKPRASFHMIESDANGVVKRIEHIKESGARINGGYFIFRREIFNYIRDGEELVEEPFHRLIAEDQLIAYQHDGFWACMDTFKEWQELEEMFAGGRAPWALWRNELVSRKAG